MKIQSSPFVSQWLLKVIDPPGFLPRAFECPGDSQIVRVIFSSRRKTSTIHLHDLAAAPSVVSGFLGRFLGPTVGIQRKDGTRIRLRWCEPEPAKDFVREVEKAWKSVYRNRFEEYREEIDSILWRVGQLESKEPPSFEAACILSPVLEAAKALNESLFSDLPIEALGNAYAVQVNRIQTFIKNAPFIRQQANERFEKRELAQRKAFFEEFESNPLTPDQRRAVVVDEDATLVLAGAGSGKTSVITAKAAYLVNAGLRHPGEVLLLAFGRDARKEMASRLAERKGEGKIRLVEGKDDGSIEVRTFHSLAKTIIETVEKRKLYVPDHANDDTRFFELIGDILKGLVAKSGKTRAEKEVARSIIRWFAWKCLDEETKLDFGEKHEYYASLEKADLRTLQGERVKSREELMIANCLYVNGIEYEYEPKYEFDVSSPERRDYHPDFRLVKSGVYIEHFGVGRKKLFNGEYRLVAPGHFSDPKGYLEGIKWKEEVHATHGTTLIKTYSYEHKQGRLLDSLKEQVEEYEKLKPRDIGTIFDRIVELNQVNGFVRLLGTFLRHCRGGGFTMEECRDKAGKLGFGSRAESFLRVFEAVHSEYRKRLDRDTDFEEMMVKAAEYVEDGKYDSPFRHILIDEFQDISRSRARLACALKAQHSDARIFAVGDDWQSIYRFAGSDVSIMRGFGEVFGGRFDGKDGIHRVVKLRNTLRSVETIAQAARRFVLKNPSQLDKDVVARRSRAKHPAIRIVSAYDEDAENTPDADGKLVGVLEVLSKLAESKKDKASALLLGRYRRQVPAELGELKARFPALELSFKTIHGSKGLEADHVVVLDLCSGFGGFPSEIADDPLLGMVLPEEEPYWHAEERRILYVAMTRARDTLTIIEQALRRSEFAKELMDDLREVPRCELAGSGEMETTDEICPGCGGRLLSIMAINGGVVHRCEHYRYCGPWCSACGKGHPKPQNEGGTAVCPSCGVEYPTCPRCADGWLVERYGEYGPFLGCVNYFKYICTGTQKVDKD